MPHRCPSSETFVMRSWNAINKIHGYLQTETNFKSYIQQEMHVVIKMLTSKIMSLQFSGHVEETKHTAQRKKAANQDI